MCTCCYLELAALLWPDNTISMKEARCSSFIVVASPGTEMLRIKVWVTQERQERHTEAVYLVFTLDVNRSHPHVTLTENL